MANICIDCTNWRKCPWSKNLDLPAEKREQPNGGVGFEVDILVKKNPSIITPRLIFYDVKACSMFNEEKKRESAGILDEKENEKFLRDPIGYLERHNTLSPREIAEIRKYRGRKKAAATVAH